jgi:outer membrane protein insertion porin family
VAAPTVQTIAEVEVRGNKRIESSAIRARISSRSGESYDPRRIAADVREVYGLGFFRDVRVFAEDSEQGWIVVFDVTENAVVRQVTLSGNDSMSSDDIRDKLTLTTGSTLDYPLLFENQERIEALYRAQGYYLAEVSYSIESLPGDAVSIDFEVKEGRKLRLRSIEFEGNEAFTNKDLTEGLDTKVWRWYSPVSRFLDRSGTYAEPVFIQDLQSVHEKYLNDGYLQVEVGDPDVSADEKGLVVSIDIVEGEQYHVGSVEVEGDESVDLEALLERLGLAEGEVFDRSQLTRDVEVLERHYTNRGFFMARVNPVTDVDQDGKVVDVTFAVEKGPLYFIREIDVTGNTITVDPVIRREMQMVEGELYSARALSLSEARIRRLGFFEEVSFETQPTQEPEELDLDVRVVERPTGSLSFGAGFSSQDKFVVSGSLSQSNLFGRGYSTSLSADIGGRSDRVFFSFTDPYFMGSDFSLTASLFRTSVDFEDFKQEQTGIEFTLGHALNLEGTARGFLRYNYSSREINENSGVNAAGVIFRELVSSAETTSLLGLAYRSDTKNDRFAPTDGRILGFSLEGAGLGGFSKFLRMEGSGVFFMRPPEWFPGWFPFRDRSSFIVGLRGGWTIPFNDLSDFDLGNTVEASSCTGNGETCALNLIDDDIKLPLSERYFLGGLGTFQLRGYRARSVGPRRAILYDVTFGGASNARGPFTPVGRDSVTGACEDFPDFINRQGNGNGKCNSIEDKDIGDFDDLDETDVIGGNKFLSLSTEYRFPIAESLGLMGIVFFDTGQAFAENENLWDFDLYRFGTGVGLQWFSPFGPLQGFLGFPIDKLEDEDSPVFEFSVGGASF